MAMQTTELKVEDVLKRRTGEMKWGSKCLWLPSTIHQAPTQGGPVRRGNTKKGSASAVGYAPINPSHWPLLNVAIATEAFHRFKCDVRCTLADVELADGRRDSAESRLCWIVSSGIKAGCDPERQRSRGFALNCEVSNYILHDWRFGQGGTKHLPVCCVVRHLGDATTN